MHAGYILTQDGFMEFSNFWNLDTLLNRVSPSIAANNLVIIIAASCGAFVALIVVVLLGLKISGKCSKA